MDKVIETIQNLSKHDIISKEEMMLIRKNKIQAANYFHAILDQMVKDPDTSNEQLMVDGFFAIAFLAEWKDTAAFSKVAAILHELGEEAEDWLGDGLTENLSSILYQLYDGNFDALIEYLYDDEITAYARAAYADIITQLYRDGQLDKERLLSIFRQFISRYEPANGYDDLVTCICGDMARAHVLEFLPDIHSLLDKGIIDRYTSDKYEDYVDMMYDEKSEIIRTTYSLEKELGRWYHFETTGNKTLSERFDNVSMQQMMEGAEDYLFGDPYRYCERNDPCPCGSGKKFKKCCLPIIEKRKTDPSVMEPPLVIKKLMRSYPQLSFDPISGKENSEFKKQSDTIYLEDRYDKDAIKIDYLVTLAFEKRYPAFKASPDAETAAAAVKHTYLKKAKEIYEEKIQREGISPKEFDDKYSIHYRLDEWIK